MVPSGSRRSRSRPMSSSAGSCSTSCQRASTASGTMGCSPRHRARPASHSRANCSMLRPHLTIPYQPSLPINARHAHVAAGIWSSWKRSNAGSNPARRHPRRHQYGNSRHDPAWPAPIRRPSITASGSHLACPPRPQHCIHSHDPVCSGPATTRAQSSKPNIIDQRTLSGNRWCPAVAPPASEIPIDHRLPSAGSCM
jgi:hypothetical protein